MIDETQASIESFQDDEHRQRQEFEDNLGSLDIKTAGSSGALTKTTSVA